MEYVFGTTGESRVLKVKGSSHTDLTGFRQIEETFPDQVITHNFHVVRKVAAKEDEAGNCYDWYEIDHYYRVVDRTLPIAAKVEENAVAAENALCELDAGYDERLSAVENALCELDAAIN